MTCKIAAQSMKSELLAVVNLPNLKPIYCYKNGPCLYSLDSDSGSKLMYCHELLLQILRVARSTKSFRQKSINDRGTILRIGNQKLNDIPNRQSQEFQKPKNCHCQQLENVFSNLLYQGNLPEIKTTKLDNMKQRIKFPEYSQFRYKNGTLSKSNQVSFHLISEKTPCLRNLSNPNKHIYYKLQAINALQKLDQLIELQREKVLLDEKSSDLIQLLKKSEMLKKQILNLLCELEVDKKKLYLEVKAEFKPTTPFAAILRHKVNKTQMYSFKELTQHLEEYYRVFIRLCLLNKQTQHFNYQKYWRQMGKYGEQIGIKINLSQRIEEADTFYVQTMAIEAQERQWQKQMPLLRRLHN